MMYMISLRDIFEPRSILKIWKNLTLTLFDSYLDIIVKLGAIVTKTMIKLRLRTIACHWLEGK